MTLTGLASTGEAPRIGFIGWGPESAALLEIFAGRFAGAQQRAQWLGVGAPPEVPPPLRAAPTLETLFAGSDLLVVAAPPDTMESLLPTARLSISDRHLVLLLGRDWSLAHVLAHLNERKLVRAMVHPFGKPGRSLTAYYATPFLSGQDLAQLRELFDNQELALELNSEAQFEAVLGLVGLVPAMLYTMADAMGDGALMTGLSRPVALKTIASLMRGAADSMLEPDAHPALLREQTLEFNVAAAGLMELESAGLRGLLMRALQKGVREIKTQKPTPSNREEE